MPKPISFEKELTKRRIVEELEEIEKGLESSDKNVRDGARNRVRDLKLAVETKPLYDSVQ